MTEYECEKCKRQHLFFMNRYSKCVHCGGKLVKPLEGFEAVIGRKLDCSDCIYFLDGRLYSWKCKFNSPKRFNLHGLKPCIHVRFQQTILDKIKLKDLEIMETKRDTHPRYLIREEMMYYIKEDPITTLLKEFNPKKNVPIRQALFKLALIL